ncbi:MAG: hypothetical protein H6607_07660 [Flavobacteriales bacterium]|nr:hypothetical protein [Flavobacteriales bacterium]
MNKLFLLIVLLSLSVVSVAQDKGVFSGNFQSNFSVFVIDSAIGAYEPPQYSSQISSAEAWLFTNYQIKGFSLSARYDLFNNSNLLNPTGTFSGHGMGFWQIKKSIDKLTLTAGSFYDQFGSGLIFRSYESRLIGIDYAIEGIHARYDINDNFFIKAFTGNQKGEASKGNRFQSRKEVVRGFNTEKIYNLKNEKGLLTLGASTFNRTLTQSDMNELVAEINGYDIAQRFYPKYNSYSYNGYANLNLKNFNFSLEHVRKTGEAVRKTDGFLDSLNGQITYATFGYSKGKLGKNKKGGIGFNAQYRHIKNYKMRVSPNDLLLDGILSYQPSLTRQASYRLLARYNAPAQDYGEQGLQADLTWTIKKGQILNLNYSNVKKLDGEQLFREYFLQYEHKFNTKWKGKYGLQSIFYNQQIYENKDTSYHDVKTLTPFMEMTYKMTSRKSLRLESQYLSTKQDLGSFVNGVLELNMSPHYSFSISDMVNVIPVRHVGSTVSDKIVHYYTLFAKYNINTTSFTLAYVKQVQGVNCTGGICRIEPAFSGIRFTLTSNF